MTGKSTATVETLTAEVRVLMVGSRQITLSVYGQLDEVDAYQIEPFGRVRPRNADPEWIHLVGRDPQTGALARASLRTLANEDLAGSLRRDYLRSEAVDIGTVEGSTTTIEGVLFGVWRRTTQQGASWASATLETPSGVIEALFFPATYQQCASLVVEDTIVIVKGRLERREGWSALIAMEASGAEVSTDAARELRTIAATRRRGYETQVASLRKRAQEAACLPLIVLAGLR